MVDLTYAKKVREEYNKTIKDKDTKETMNEPIKVSLSQNRDNVVSEEKLRAVQKETLTQAMKYLSKTFGPMGSNTKIITGEEIKTVQAIYSKDGAKVLSYIMNSNPLEASIIEELIDITGRVDKEVGDGTTSTVILSSLIFDGLINVQNKYNIPPYKLMRLFDKEVDNIKKLILERKKEATLDDIYDISMISTNGNEEVANNIKSIYDQYGMNMDLSVGISNTVDNVIKVYDGFTITEGMENPVYINNAENNTCEIHNANIYHFVDPIDDINQINLLEAILRNNIYDKLREQKDPVPTVITCPRVSRDLSVTLRELTDYLNQFNAAKKESIKPPILIITNVVASDELIMNDISTLCGGRDIKKYIDPKVYERDKENGNAPTVDNICEFAGKCELVVADSKKTKFINPVHMHKEDENGNVIDDPVYASMVGFLETEIKEAENSGEDSSVSIGLLKKRLSALKANMAEFLVGGVTIADRDAVRDLVQDAVKNCKSALSDGVGYAANFEGLRASYQNFLNRNNESCEIVSREIAELLFNAYFNISEILYTTVEHDKEKVEAYVIQSLENDAPFDISSGELPELNVKGTKVKCAIMLDIQVLDTISKIISKMATCNQLLVQSPKLNYY